MYAAEQRDGDAALAIDAAEQPHAADARAAAPEILSVRSPEKQQMILRLTDESGAEDVSDPVVDGGGELISPQQLALTRPLGRVRELPQVEAIQRYPMVHQV